MLLPHQDSFIMGNLIIIEHGGVGHRQGTGAGSARKASTEKRKLWGHRSWVHLQSQLNLQNQRQRRIAASHAPAPCHSGICMQRAAEQGRNELFQPLRRKTAKSPQNAANFTHCSDKTKPFSSSHAFPPENDVAVYREPDGSRMSPTLGPCLAKLTLEHWYILLSPHSSLLVSRQLLTL